MLVDLVDRLRPSLVFSPDASEFVPIGMGFGALPLKIYTIFELTILPLSPSGMGVSADTLSIWHFVIPEFTDVFDHHQHSGIGCLARASCHPCVHRRICLPLAWVLVPCPCLFAIPVHSPTYFSPAPFMRCTKGFSVPVTVQVAILEFTERIVELLALLCGALKVTMQNPVRSFCHPCIHRRIYLLASLCGALKVPVPCPCLFAIS